MDRTTQAAPRDLSGQKVELFGNASLFGDLVHEFEWDHKSPAI